VMNREMDLERLISHRFPLQEASRALELAAHPQPSSMKVVIQPGLAWQHGAWEGCNQ
jgi:threonine dehydrogenase-like Zn-dependent dehydrogenase